MTIWISSLELAPQLAKLHSPQLIVSLLSPYDDFPVFDGHARERHLKVPIHDITQDFGDWVAPGESDAQKVVDFVSQWDKASPILIHCWAGISRSTASAFITACIHNPQTPEVEIAQAIRAASPTASPNRKLVAHADDILRRGGRMREAVDAIGRGEIASQAIPFFIPSDFGPKAVK
jgi:predicted protein tyrosine phosphatase